MQLGLENRSIGTWNLQTHVGEKVATRQLAWLIGWTQWISRGVKHIFLPKGSGQTNRRNSASAWYPVVIAGFVAGGMVKPKSTIAITHSKSPAPKNRRPQAKKPIAIVRPFLTRK